MQSLGNYFRLLPLHALAIWACAAISAGGADPFTQLRQQMVDTEIVAAGIKNPRVIEAMRRTPRHEFMPFAQRRLAYFDMAVPIGSSQTISPPYVVAFMTEQLDPQPTDRVLEIGAGSGYQAAVLSGLVKEVYTIEIVEPLGRRAARTLHRLGYANVHVKVGDGFQGWPKFAPFDKVIVTCSPEDVPQPLVDQLAEGGRMVVPLGERHQQALVLLRKEGGKLIREPLQPTLFVPMTGEAEERRQVLPDPLNPRINNGGFESSMPKSKLPQGWHYVRQAEVVQAPAEAFEGVSYLRFQNREPGRGSRALQGFAVDGGQVPTLLVRMQTQGEGVRSGAGPDDRPGVLVTFYDKRRGLAGSGRVEAPQGNYLWTSVQGRVRVPLSATEAIIWIGLHGATGELEIDEVSVEAVGLSPR